MKIELISLNGVVRITVTEVPEHYRAALQHSFYQERDGVYLKEYDESSLMFPHDLNILKRNLNHHLERMLTDNLKTTAMDWESSLDKLATMMENHHIRWWLAGSAALAARGINISPQDIDIMTFKSEIGKIQQAFGSHIVEPFHHVTGWVVKGFGVIYLNGRIDFAFEPEDSVDSMGAVDFGPTAQSNLEIIEWRGHKLLVPPIELHLLPNKRRTRTEVVTLIEDYICRNRYR